MGERAFSVAALRLWNALLLTVRDIFKKLLKHIFLKLLTQLTVMVSILLCCTVVIILYYSCTSVYLLVLFFIEL